LMDLTRLVRELLEEVSASTGIRARPGWPSGQETYPLVTVLMVGASVERADVEHTRFFYRLAFQIDVWHVSAEECDGVASRLVEGLARAAARRNWFLFRVESMRDIPEEEVYRKMIEISFMAVG